MTMKPVGRRGGFVLTEMLVALALLGVLMVSFWRIQTAVAEYNGAQQARRQCLAAGRAQLDSIAATGVPLAAADVQRLWPRVACEITRSPGGDPWQGLSLVTVTASVETGAGTVRQAQHRYLDLGREDNQ